MRSRFPILLAILISTLAFTPRASADVWDIVYGEDPTNANNVSAFLDVKADPKGGVFLIGYFYGTYEGLVSGNSYSFFVQHRNTGGTVDWTVAYESLSSGLTPSKLFESTIDGNGTLFIQSFSRRDTRANSKWYSVTRTGVLTADPANEIGRAHV